MNVCLCNMSKKTVMEKVKEIPYTKKQKNEKSPAFRKGLTMRLWSLAPQYLDVKGLLAVWREGLLAKKVLEGKTKGYTAHPQLWRFRQYEEPRKAITAYLAVICAEAQRRGYSFDGTKLESSENLRAIIPVTKGQVAYEWAHLLKKLYQRDIERWNQLQSIPLQEVQVHPLFYLVPGPVEGWEKVL